MANFNQNEIDLMKEKVNNYVTSGNPEKPMMIIFGGEDDKGESLTPIDQFRHDLEKMFKCAVINGGHPFKQGHEHLIYNGKIEKISDHPELLEEPILPSHVNKDTQLIVFYRYVDQFNQDVALSYAVDIVKEHKIPVVYLANGYQRQSHLDVCLDVFDLHIVE